MSSQASPGAVELQDFAAEEFVGLEDFFLQALIVQAGEAAGADDGPERIVFQRVVADGLGRWRGKSDASQ